MIDKFAIVDPAKLEPADELLRAAKAALHDHHNYSHFEQSEKVMADLQEAIRRVEMEPGPGGWIVWEGGPCPVWPESIVDISHACGEIETNVVANHYTWSHSQVSADRDITSFRLVKGGWRKLSEWTR